MAGRRRTRFDTPHELRSRALVRAFVAIGGLLVLALLGVLVAPFFIDWSVYRADFEREASRMLGRTVSVRGDASARLLPFPTLTFTDVVVEGEAAGAEPLLAIGRFRMDAELAPYLSGEIRIFSMEIEKPRLRLPISAAGAVPWIGTAAVLPTNATIVLEKIDVRDGTLTLENQLAGRTQQLTGIEAQLSAASLSGPYAGSGNLALDGRAYAFLLSTGAVQPDGQLPLKLTVNSDILDAEVVLDGAAGMAGSLPRFQGSLGLTSPRPRAAVAGAQARATASERLLPDLALSSEVIASPKTIDLTEIRVEAGAGENPYVLTGAGSLDLGRLPHFDLSLEGEQVDVDEIAGGGERPRAPVTFDERLEVARRVLAAVPRPAMPGTLRIVLPVVLAGDTTIRDVAFAATPTGSGWSMENLRAELPGRTRLEATGVVGLDEEMSFAGDLLLASRQPSGFATWLTGEVAPAIRRLPQAGFSATVRLDRDEQRLDALEVDVGGDILKGWLQRTGTPGARRLGADLRGGGIDLDAFLALSRLFTGKTDLIADSDRLALKLQAGPVSFSDAAARRIDADLAFEDRRLTVRRFDLDDLAGADIAVSGEVADLGAGPGGRLAVKLDTPDPARLAEFLRIRLPPSPALETLVARAATLAPLVLAGTMETVTEASGEEPTLRLGLTGTAAETAVELSLALGNGIYAQGTSGRFGLELQLSSPSPDELIRQLGLDAIPVDTPEPLDVKLSLSAGASGPVAASAAVRAPGTEMTAEGTFDIAPSGITAADFGLTARSDDVSPWLTATGWQIGQSPLETLPAEVSGNLAWFKGDWTLKGLNAAVAGSAIAGELQKTSEGPVTGPLTISNLSLPWLATIVYGRAPASLAPDGGWPEGGFTAPLLPAVDLAVDLSVGRLFLRPGLVVADLGTRLDAGAGRLGFQDASGAIFGGYVRGSAALQNVDGIGGLALSASLSGLDLGAVALSAGTGPEGASAGAGGEPGVSGTLDGKLSLDATGQSYAALVAGSTGAGSVSFENASLGGVRAGLFAPILAAADAEGFRPETAAVQDLLGRLAAGGRYEVPAATSDFAIVGGVARFAPIIVQHAGEALSADVTLDLGKAVIGGALKLAFDPGDEAVEGSDPAILYDLSGPLTAPKLLADVQPLVGYLSALALEREEARLEAMQDQLQERLRLRREARYSRWTQAQRDAAAAVSAEAERLRLLRLQDDAESRRAADEARRAEESARAQQRAEEEREQKAAAERPAGERARPPTPRPSNAGGRPAVRPQPSPSPSPRPPALDLDTPPRSATPQPSTAFPSLPGVGNPLEF